MVSVAVVGGGIAGAAASKAAAETGARVSLFEQHGRLRPPKSSWPLLSDRNDVLPRTHAPDALQSLGVDLRLGDVVNGVGEDGTLLTGKGRSRFDAVVLASGRRAVRSEVRGGARAGLLALDGLDSFIALEEALRGYSRVAISGEGPLALRVVYALVRRRIHATVFAPRGIMASLLGTAPRKRLDDAISLGGVSLVRAKPESVAGVGAVEAVVAEGIVFPCQALLVVPQTLPSIPETSAKRGRLGGVVIDGLMRSSVKGIYAAGSCAEIVVGSTTTSSMLESTALTMGEAAGANAAGAHLSPRITNCMTLEAFGVEIVYAGLDLDTAVLAGLDASEVSWDPSEGPACSLVYDRGSLRVLGVQIVGSGAKAYALAAPVMVSTSIGIDELAYLEFPTSTDISPLVEAAREGLRRR